MIILDSTKALSTLVTDTTNGLGQIQPLECIVTEELNGIYEMDFTVSTEDPHYEDLKNSGLVKVEVGDGSEQIFRVYYISEPINFIVDCKAQHITYDLSKVIVKPFTSNGAVNTVNQMLTHVLGNYPFTMSTDITNTTSTFTLDIPRYFRECLGGYEGSILDVFRPEYEWDNLEVKMLARRGSDRNVRIAYGKNLTDFTQEQNNENVYDAVYGYAVVDEVTYEATSIYNKTGASYPRVLNVDFSDKYESGDVPTGAELLQYATTYATNNDIEIPKVNIKIEFVPLWQTEEYKNILPLEKVALGDTVHVYFDKLNVEAAARVIKTEWNVLTKKYDSLELGDAKANLNTIINDSVERAKEDIVNSLDIDTGFIEDEMEDLSRLIINGLGLYFTKQELQTGGYRFILHNEPLLANSTVMYYMSASGLMISTDGGTTWDSAYDTQTGELIIQALSTITVRALQIYGSYIQGSQIVFGDPSDTNGKYIIAEPYPSGTTKQGVTFDGTGTIRMQPQEAFYVNNIASDGTHYYNRIIMNKNGSYSNNYLQFVNFDDLNGYSSANMIDMSAHISPTGNNYNRIWVGNYATTSGTQYEANRFVMNAYPDRNNATITNYKPLLTDITANNLTLSASSTLNQLTLYNYKKNEDNNANYIGLYSQSTTNYINLTNIQFASGSISVANRIMFESDSSGNSLTIANYEQTSASSVSPKNLIRMKSDSTTLIWSSSDLMLHSGGAVRMFANHNRIAGTGDYYDYMSGTEQDAYVGGYSVKLQCQNRIYLYYGSKGNRYMITCGSDGYVHCQSA